MSKKSEYKYDITEVAPLVKLHVGYLSSAVSKKMATLSAEKHSIFQDDQRQLIYDLKEVDGILKQYSSAMNHSRYPDFEFSIQFNMKTEKDAEDFVEFDEFSNYGFTVRHIDDFLKLYYSGCFMGNDYKKLAFGFSVSALDTKKHISHFLAWSEQARVLILNRKIKHIEVTHPEDIQYI